MSGDSPHRLSLLQSPSSILFLSPAISQPSSTLPLLSPSLLASPALPSTWRSTISRSLQGRTIDEEGDEVEEIEEGTVISNAALPEVCAECKKTIGFNTPGKFFLFF